MDNKNKRIRRKNPKYNDNFFTEKDITIKKIKKKKKNDIKKEKGIKKEKKTNINIKDMKYLIKNLQEKINSYCDIEVLEEPDKILNQNELNELVEDIRYIDLYDKSRLIYAKILSFLKRSPKLNEKLKQIENLPDEDLEKEFTINIELLDYDNLIKLQKYVNSKIGEVQKNEQIKKLDYNEIRKKLDKKQKQLEKEIEELKINYCSDDSSESDDY